MNLTQTSFVSSSLISILLAACAVSVADEQARGTSSIQLPGKLKKTHVVASRDPLIADSHYKLWIPNNTSNIRVLFVINMRAAGRRVFHSDAEWRRMASRNSAAMMFCEFEANEVRNNGYGLSMLKACDQFAAKLKQPELKHAPFVLWGHSMGGRVVQDFVRFKPERVLAFHIALRAHPTPNELMTEEAAALRAPGLYLMGERDGKPRDIREHFHRARKADSPRAWVWLPGQSHWPVGMSFEKDNSTLENWRAWAAHDVVIPWTEAMIKLRLPEDVNASEGPVKLVEIDTTRGWLGEISSGRVDRIGAFPDTRGDTSWFPNETTARAWAKFVSVPRSNR